MAEIVGSAVRTIPGFPLESKMVRTADPTKQGIRHAKHVPASARGPWPEEHWQGQWHPEGTNREPILSLFLGGWHRLRTTHGTQDPEGQGLAAGCHRPYEKASKTTVWSTR